MSRVWICQLLCPARHCLVAVAYERPTTTPAEADADLRQQMAALHINPWCGLCGSRDVHAEHGRTRWRTLTEATPHLRAEEQQQRRTREIFGKRDEP